MGWVMNATPRPLYPRERPGTHCILGGPQGRYGLVRKISPWPRFDPRTFQSVTSRCTYWAIPDHVWRNVGLYTVCGACTCVRRMSCVGTRAKERRFDAVWCSSTQFLSISFPYLYEILAIVKGAESVLQFTFLRTFKFELFEYWGDMRAVTLLWYLLLAVSIEGTACSLVYCNHTNKFRHSHIYI